MSASRTAGVYFDLYNVLNSGKATAVTEASGATFGVPNGWSAARALQVGIRVNF